jgi:hypothetical protein
MRTKAECLRSALGLGPAPFLSGIDSVGASGRFCEYLLLVISKQWNWARRMRRRDVHRRLGADDIWRGLNMADEDFGPFTKAANDSL